MNLQQFVQKMTLKGRFIDTLETNHYIRVNYRDFLGIKHWRIFDKETGERVA